MSELTSLIAKMRKGDGIPFLNSTQLGALNFYADEIETWLAAQPSKAAGVQVHSQLSGLFYFVPDMGWCCKKHKGRCCLDCYTEAQNAANQPLTPNAGEVRWTEREEEVIAELMTKQELSRHAVLRQGLRLFQLHVEGLVNIPPLAASTPAGPRWELGDLSQWDYTCANNHKPIQMRQVDGLDCPLCAAGAAKEADGHLSGPAFNAQASPKFAAQEAGGEGARRNLRTEARRLLAVYQTAYANAHCGSKIGVIESDEIAVDCVAIELEKLLAAAPSTRETPRDESWAARQGLTVERKSAADKPQPPSEGY